MPREAVKFARERNTNIITMGDMEKMGIDKTIEMALEMAWKDVDMVLTSTPSIVALFPEQAGLSRAASHHGLGHNHAHGDHLSSQMHYEDEAADLQVLATQFIEGFLQASDKIGYLKLAGVPFERPSKDGAKALKLIDVELKTDWRVGTASPSFGSRELSDLPFPGQMVQDRTKMSLIYVSLHEKATFDIRDFLYQRKQEVEE